MQNEDQVNGSGQFVEMVEQRHSRGITRKTQKAIMFEKFHSENPLLLSLCRTLFPNNHKSVWCGPHSLVQREVYARTSSILAAIETLMIAEDDNLLWYSGVGMTYLKIDNMILIYNPVSAFVVIYWG
ncbi:hypothetical protein GH714_022666 [Hevea brasiliensis]|uniref:Uncharacterized protein n=1 Tax=Hevea brasiliensis TaxID=3981 RepID=A0A6A6N3P5_HEVBR|nr:hypothetical protein GH714_022666 [Hevea brasiliensis]